MLIHNLSSYSLRRSYTLCSVYAPDVRRIQMIIRVDATCCRHVGPL